MIHTAQDFLPPPCARSVINQLEVDSIESPTSMIPHLLMI
jgi:hypothetical protein